MPSPNPDDVLATLLKRHTPQVRNGPFITCSCGWEYDEGDGDQWREHILAAASTTARESLPVELRALSEAASPGPYMFNGYPFTLAGADAEFAIAACNYVRSLAAKLTEEPAP